jgi:type II secretory pathway pseudopilin PulG
VVVAILGVLAAVAVPNVGKFIGKGKTEAKETELHNVQTAVMAMLADSTSGVLTNATVDLSGNYTQNLYLVTATRSGTTLHLSSYVTGLNVIDGTHAVVKTPCKYSFLVDGSVIQAAFLNILITI